MSTISSWARTKLARSPCAPIVCWRAIITARMPRAKAFHRGWFLTGDLGFLHCGEVYVIGRKKDLIIVGGKNIFPQDLENLACTVEGIHPGRAVAFGLMNEELGTEEVVIVAEMEAGLDGPELMRELEGKVRLAVIQGSEIAPRVVKVLRPPWILKTSSGKTARAANRDKYLSQFGGR